MHLMRSLRADFGANGGARCLVRVLAVVIAAVAWQGQATGADETEQTTIYRLLAGDALRLVSPSGEPEINLTAEGSPEHVDAAPADLETTEAGSIRFAKDDRVSALQVLPQFAGDAGIEFWVKPEAADDALVVLNGDSARNGWAIMVRGGKWSLLYGGAAFHDSSAPVQPQQWQHLAMVSRKGRHILYVDGVRAVVVAQRPRPAEGRFVMGGTPSNAAQGFAGLIHAVRVFAPGGKGFDPASDLNLSEGLRQEVRRQRRLATYPFGDGPFINTWLVAGLFEHAQVRAPLDVGPQAGDEIAGQPWRYFDDRLFSRNLDDYQDLRSYYKIMRRERVINRCALAHVYIHSEQAQAAQLRIGADREFSAWFNGEPVLAHREMTAKATVRDAHQTDVQLAAGWNRLLLRVANREAGLFGFYARVCDSAGNALPGVTYSPHGPAEKLTVSTGAMRDIETGSMPMAYRAWTYVRLNPLEWVDRSQIPKLSAMAWATAFALTAEGGQPPYQWTLEGGSLPAGLELHEDGRIRGIVAEDARLGEHAFTVAVRDARGATARKRLTIGVHERPNRVLEQMSLVGLIHRPEHTPADGFDDMARLMARQGYQMGIPVAWGNGPPHYTYNSIYEPDTPLGDLISPYKQALAEEGVSFGMYFGNLVTPNIGEENGAILAMEEAMVRWQPRVLWFDWAAWWDGGYALDAMFSMVKTRSPDTVIILNQALTNRYGMGDWDVICMEGWPSWGEAMWANWPFEMDYAKRFRMLSWRLLIEPDYVYTRGMRSDWRDYLKVQLSLIGEGFIADIDHSPTISGEIYTFKGRLDRLEEGHLMQAHMAMADWASPEGVPPLHESYTWVEPGPLGEQPWGYNLRSVKRPAIYLHLMENGRGKTGMPDEEKLVIGPVRERVREVIWMNRNQPVSFEQEGDRVTVDLRGIEEDVISTILKLTYQQ